MLSPHGVMKLRHGLLRVIQVSNINGCYFCKTIKLSLGNIRGFMYVYVNNIKEYVKFMELCSSIVGGFIYVHVNIINEGSLCNIYGST